MESPWISLLLLVGTGAVFGFLVGWYAHGGW